MRKSIWGTTLVAAWLALAPGGAWAQPGPSTPTSLAVAPVPWEASNDRPELGGNFAPPPYVARGQVDAYGAAGYAPPDQLIPNPLPIGSTRPEDGGLFIWTQFAYYRWTNPLKAQFVAQRGFQVVDSSVQGFAPGEFVGSGTKALDIQQVSGPNEYQPGYELGLGWKFSDGSALSISYLFLSERSLRATATLAPPGLRVGPDLSDSFLSSPVFNYPSDYAGPANKVFAAPANPQAVFGVWNGASEMTLSFIQRFQQWDMTYRIPVYDTECYRLTGLMGPRFVWIWERLAWNTIDFDATGASADSALYTNITSNRMYGAHLGATGEYYLGHGFAVMCTAEGSFYVDSVKERAKYEGPKFAGFAENKRAIHEWTFAPGVNATLGLMWYPTEAIQLQIGYDVMAFFNTLSSPNPIDFDYSALSPKWVGTNRFFDGWRAGISFHF